MIYMNNITTKLNIAKRFYTRKNFVESERLYRELFYENKDAFGRDEKVFFLQSINEVYIKEDSFTFQLEEQANFVLENFTQEDASNRNFVDPYAEIFINIARIYNKKNSHLKAFQWIWKVNRDYLTTYNPRINSRAYGYSLKEKYYSYIIDSLFGLKKYDGAMEFANEAMEVLPESRTDAKLFIRYKLAKVHYELGNYEDSLEILNDIIKVKKENYVYSTIAKNYYGLENYDESLSYAVKAVLSNRSIQNNLSTYMLLGELLDKKGMKEESVKHYYLVYTYKKANNNKISSDLADKIRDANLDMENTNFRKVQKELIQIWNELKYENMIRYSGTIKKVFENDRIGFIKNDFDSNDTFFSFNEFKDEEYLIFPGTKVSFYVEPTFDKSKGRESTKAVEIEVIY